MWRRLAAGDAPRQRAKYSPVQRLEVKLGLLGAAPLDRLADCRAQAREPIFE